MSNNGMRRFVVAIMGLGLTTCADADQPVAPMGSDLALLQSQARPPYATPGDALGPPNAFTRHLEIDFPDDPPAYFADDDALIAAVTAAAGWVHVGFKEPAVLGLTDRVVGPFGARTATIEPVGRASLTGARSAVQGLGAEIVFPFRDLPGVVAVIDPATAPRIRALPFVDYVEPVTSGVPGGQITPSNIQKIRAPQAWPVSTGGGVYMVIMDTGVAGGFSHHTDLPSITPYTCLVTIPNDNNCADNPAYAFYGHGIGVAGVAFAKNNSADVVGAAYGVNSFWTSIRVCAPATGCGNAAVAAALNWVAQNGRKDIVNMSIHGNYSAQVATAVAAAYSSGDLLVAIAGNSTVTQVVTHPGAYSQVIAVSGTTASDGFDPGSVQGSAVELSAPFTVTSLGNTSGTATRSGTSFASPAVAGVAALIWAQNPGWTNAQVRSKLQNSVEDFGASGRDPQFGYGRIDACFAVEAGCQSVIPLSGFIVGPNEVPPGATCTWQMITDGARKPYSYQWASPLGGSQSWASGNLYQSQSISVTTTSTDGQQIVRSMWVTVSEEADECVQ